jgi:tetratricopeptide (TPR) repeat protein/SAM-dependent methyltransferase
MELTIDQALQQGVAAHKEGKLQDAERLYRAILQAQPEHPDANHNLGVLAVGVGKPLEAIPLFKLALEANPKIEQFWLSYIDALIKMERFDEAQRVVIEGEKSGVSSEKLNALKQRLFSNVPNDPNKIKKSQTLSEKRRKLAEKKKIKKLKSQGSVSGAEPSQYEINYLIENYQAGRLEKAEALATTLTQQFPKHPFGWKVLGVVLKQTGRLAESLAPMQSAVTLSPQDVEAHNNLGVTLKELGRLDDAEASYGQAIGLKPDFAEAHSNLGNTLEELGRLDEAEASYSQAIALKPDYAEAHYNLGNTLKELDRLDEAEASYSQAIALKPDYAEAHYNLGNTLKELDRLDEAEASYSQSIALKPDYAEAHYNLGVTLDELGRLDDAEASYSQAIAVKPDYAEAHNNLGNTLQELGRLDEAEASYKQAIAVKPDFAEAHYNLGNTLKELGRFDEAEASYSQAIALKPDFAEAHYNLGITLQELGRLDEAEASYKQAIAVKPDFAEAHNNLGNTLKELGRLDESISSYVRAINLKADFYDAYRNLGLALKSARFSKGNQSLYPILINLLTEKNYVQPSDVAGAILSLLRLDDLVEDVLVNTADSTEIKKVNQAITTLAQVPLLHQLMRICPLPDLQLEASLVSMRRVLLKGLGKTEASTEVIHFLSTLTLQCFTNEYIYLETEEEAELIGVLEAAIAERIAQASQPTITEILVLATYRPVHQYEWIEKLQALDHLPEVKVRLIEEPLAERVIAQNIPVLSDVDDDVSRKVREQYEESPYPRWVKLAIAPTAKSVAEVCNAAKLQLHSEAIKSVVSPSVLIAGCGTGQHSIETASRFANCTVKAVDLSRASLAYAQRKTNELGITNIEYLQADILNLSDLGQKFDIIESAGVLHHMDNPMAGWTVLVDLLKNGGLMKIGLYSESARRHIVKTREEIGLRGIVTSEAEVKHFRQSLVESHDAHHQELAGFRDFFSLSEVRDLVFHVQEHRFTLPQIQKCLDELGLKFCGFESRDIVRRFKYFFGKGSDACDLSQWHQFEEENPRTFAGMYQFWCQKK